MQLKKKIVVVGGGFAGLNFVRNIDPNLFEVVLIDKLNHHQFQPLFYQVATSQLEPSSISFPLRHIFRKMPHVYIRLGNVERVDTSQKVVHTNIGDFTYDYFVLAMGCKTNFFGNNEIKKHAFTLKTTYEAITIRNHILQIFERIITASSDEKPSLLNMVIVGAGPTGVELAGSFAEIKKNILPRDYHRIDFSKFNIILVEGSKNTLNNMSQLAKDTSRLYLDKIGVEVITERYVKNYDGESLVLSDGTIIKTKTVIWSAGVIANSILGLPSETLGAGNRLKVDRYNRLQGFEDIFVLGDLALMPTPKYPNGHPQLANVAINQAKLLSKNIKNLLQNKSITEYEYRDLGSMATLSRNKAVVDLPFIHFKGFIAWMIWMFLHLMLILSVRNKMIIFINWAWAYFTKDTALRLILKDTSE
jgi:NADH dehydrogenase